MKEHDGKLRHRFAAPGGKLERAIGIEPTTFSLGS